MLSKEMFERLGFEWKETKDFIEYRKYHFKHFIFRSKIIIRFWKNPLKEFSIYDDSSDVEIDIELFQAINQQVKELRWFDE